MNEKDIYETYLDSYRNVCPDLSNSELDFIRKHLNIIFIKKKEIYLSQGKAQQEMGFLYEGLLRSYYIDKSGKKVTISFIRENSYASDYPSFIQQKPSKYFIQALEDSIIVNLSYNTIQKAYNTTKNFERYGRLISEQILIKKQQRIESFLFENAEERYLQFIENNQGIINRISLSHLSSYLGIERQSLSRIRKKLARK